MSGRLSIETTSQMNLSTVEENNGADLQNYLQMYVSHRLIVFCLFYEGFSQVIECFIYFLNCINCSRNFKYIIIGLIGCVGYKGHSF
jgi:hypothetical protein